MDQWFNSHLFGSKSFICRLQTFFFFFYERDPSETNNYKSLMTGQWLISFKTNLTTSPLPHPLICFSARVLIIFLEKSKFSISLQKVQIGGRELCWRGIINEANRIFVKAVRDPHSCTVPISIIKVQLRVLEVKDLFIFMPVSIQFLN